MIRTIWAIALGMLLLSAGAIASGCSPTVAKPGDTVTVEYTLTLDDGSVYYTTSGREPAKYELGKAALITGFEEAVTGMRIGESKTVTIPPDKAYGPVRPELVQEVNRDRLPEGFEPAVGKQLQTTLNGTPVTVVIREVTPTTVTVDANHALAGKSLTFSVELLAIGGTNGAGGLADQPTQVWVLAGAVAVLAAVLVVYYLRTRRRPLPVKAVPGNGQDALLGELARLDDDFEGGRITEEAYRRARTQKKEELTKLLESTRGRG